MTPEENENETVNRLLSNDSSTLAAHGLGPRARKKLSTPEKQEPGPDLARRLVACKRFRWMPGMLDQCSEHSRIIRIVIDESHSEPFLDYISENESGEEFDGYRPDFLAMCEYQPHGDFLPDLADPATLGCLLALVREAWGQPKLYVSPHGLAWRMKIKGLGGPFRECSWGDTEAEALVAALLEAPPE